MLSEQYGVDYTSQASTRRNYWCLRLWRQMPGVSGVHVMAYRQEESVAEVIERSGVLAGRVPWFPERDKQPEYLQK